MVHYTLICFDILDGFFTEDMVWVIILAFISICMQVGVFMKQIYPIPNNLQL